MAAAGSLAPQIQPFELVEAVYTLVVDDPSLEPEQRVDAPEAVADKCDAISRMRALKAAFLSADSDELGQRFRFKLGGDSEAKWYGAGVLALVWSGS